MDANYEEKVMGTESGDLNEVMDTNVSGGTLEFVKDNAAVGTVFILAGIGAYNVGKKIVTKIKSKIPEKKDKPMKPTLKERIQARKTEKKKEEKTPEKEAE